MRCNAMQMPTYAYIDAAYLLDTFDQMSRYIFGQSVKLSIPGLRSKLQAQVFQVDKVFAYQAVREIEPEIAGESEKKRAERLARNHRSERRTAFAEEMKPESGCHVIHGTATRRAGKGGSEKEVDSLLAVDALKAAALGLTKKMAFFAGDLDMVPVVAAVQEFGVFARVAAFKWHAQERLMDVADERIYIEPIELLQMIVNPTPRSFALQPPPGQIYRHAEHPFGDAKVHIFRINEKFGAIEPCQIWSEEIEVVGRALDFLADPWKVTRSMSL